jgi:hypothetical protein|tara:strand:- start:1901 stop:2134 length:234 start_codon:yes stop_codon:yes gene_type:complete
MSFLYLIERVDYCSFDEYDAAVVVADSEKHAKCISPDINETSYSTWVAPCDVKVTLLGTAQKALINGDVVCASFKAA